MPINPNSAHLLEWEQELAQKVEAHGLVRACQDVEVRQRGRLGHEQQPGKPTCGKNTWDGRLNYGCATVVGSIHLRTDTIVYCQLHNALFVVVARCHEVQGRLEEARPRSRRIGTRGGASLIHRGD